MELKKSSHIYGRFGPIMGVKCFTLVLFTCIVQVVYGQGESSPDFMRSIGKIYVVAAVCLLILLTLLAYMIILDRKIARLEKRQKNE